MMTDIENIFDESSTDGLNARLSDFYKQLESFSQNSESVEYATTFRASAQKVVKVLNQYAAELSDIKDQYIYNAKTDVASVNSAVEEIAQLNLQIKGEYVRGATPNELLDKRNLLLDNLSNMTGASYELQADGQISVKLGSQVLLDSANNNEIKKLSVESSDNTVSVLFGSEQADISTGTLSGYLSRLNGMGNFASLGEDGSMGIKYFQKSIDDFAKAFADNFNYYNGDSLFTGDSAKTISISDEWLKNSQFITRSTETSPTTEGKNDNLLRMLSSMDKDQNINGVPGTFEEYVTSLIGDMSVEVKYEKDMKNSSSAVLNTITNQRESVMGVSIDEEGVNMVKFQKSYNAAARIMTTMDEMLDTLINSTGKVGR
jgi:flagellar hook-associated protein 1 FlgK